MNNQSVQNLIDSQYEELATSFKPQFGNPHHIQIREYSEEIAKKEKLLRAKLESAKEAKRLQKEISMLKRNVLHILKNL